MGEWISVKEKLPPAKEDVLFVAVFGQGADAQPCACYGYKDSDDPESNLWYDRLDTDRDGKPIDVYTVTHWLPVPAFWSSQPDQPSPVSHKP